MTHTYAPPAPPRTRKWLVIALILSLAVNALVIGAAVARFVAGGPPDRMSGSSQVQIIPRKFFGELPRERKAELLGVFKTYAPLFRDGRRAARQDIQAVADALDTEPYDAARVKSAVDGFSTRSDGLIAAGGQAALTLIEKLSPDERKLLARHIRQRADHGRGRGGDGPEGGPDDGGE